MRLPGQVYKSELCQHMCVQVDGLISKQRDLQGSVELGQLLDPLVKELKQLQGELRPMAALHSPAPTRSVALPACRSRARLMGTKLVQLELAHVHAVDLSPLLQSMASTSSSLTGQQACSGSSQIRQALGAKGDPQPVVMQASCRVRVSVRRVARMLPWQWSSAAALQPCNPCQGSCSP